MPKWLHQFSAQSIVLSHSSQCWYRQHCASAVGLVLQAFGQQMMQRLQGFATISQMKRLALLLLARTFTDKDVIRLKVSPPQASA